MITPFGELPNELAVDMSLAEQHDWLHRRLSRRRVLQGGAALSAAVLSTAFWTQPARAASATTVYGRHLAYGSDPATSMIVSFAVTGSFQRAVVIANAGGASVSRSAEVQTVPGSPNLYCRADFTGLAPDTEYVYDIELDGVKLATSSMQTAPSRPDAFRFTAFGDQGQGTRPAQVLTRVDQLAPRLHIVAGDLSYADSSGKGGPGDAFNGGYWDRWLTQLALSRPIPWMCAMGNHEMEPGFDLHGYAGVLTRVPIGGTSPLTVPVATTFRVGNVGFIGLDSNDVSYEIPANLGWTDNAQTSWLAETLAGLRRAGSGIDFIVVYLHHAPYSTSSAHGSEGGIRKFWVPLFDQYTVDLVISGHNHSYERTLPLRGGKVTDDSTSRVSSAAGTTYVVAGGGGQEATPGFHDGYALVAQEGGADEREKETWSIATRTADYALLCVDVEPSTATSPAIMRLQTITQNGAVIDNVELRREPSDEPAAKTADHEAVWFGVGGTAVAAAALAGGALWWKGRGTADSTDGDGDPVPSARLAEQGGNGPNDRRAE